jgi:2-isopropylmalate synthase
VEVPLEVHFHNDMGLSLANSIAAVGAGASGISTAVNGLGERAGIVATEEAIAALHILYGIDFFELGKLTELSHFVEGLTGISMPPMKPITGQNVCTHSSGIHQHGVLRDPVTYEFYPARLFGRDRKIEIDELSGRHGVIYVARNVLGLDISEGLAKRVIAEVKASYSRGGRQTAYSPPELRALIMRATGE